jgi:alcohol-forming fatty acyl-CoA reductase
VREHRRLGHRTVLITGALDFAIGPLRPLFDDVVCARLDTRPDGTYRGELTDVPPTGEARASVLADYAAANGFDLAEGVAYADSTSDLPMLEAVGFPVAVNPETRLAALARKRGWLVEHFDKADGAPAPPPPIGPAWKGRGGDGLLTRILTADVWSSGNGRNGRSDREATAGGRR